MLVRVEYYWQVPKEKATLKNIMREQIFTDVDKNLGLYEVSTVDNSNNICKCGEYAVYLYSVAVTLHADDFDCASVIAIKHLEKYLNKTKPLVSKIFGGLRNVK